MMLTTPLFECHITVDKPTNMQYFEDLAKENGWKTSYIEGDPLFGQRGFFYFTSYDTKFDRMMERMEDMANRIPSKVLRKKIEQILYDTKKRLL